MTCKGVVAGALKEGPARRVVQVLDEVRKGPKWRDGQRRKAFVKDRRAVGWPEKRDVQRREAAVREGGAVGDSV